MELPPRTFLRLSASAAALPFTTYLVGAQSLHPPPASAARELPLANRLADYTHGVRYEDFDEATIERAKTHVIDTRMLFWALIGSATRAGRRSGGSFFSARPAAGDDITCS